MVHNIRISPNFMKPPIITFRVRRSGGEMYSGHGRLCVRVCLSVPRRIPTLLHGPGVTWENGSGCPLVVHYWADLQSLHGFRCYENIARTQNVSECLYSLYVWLISRRLRFTRMIAAVCTAGFHWWRSGNITRFGHVVMRVGVCVCLCVSAAACPHYRMDPDVTWRNGRGAL